MSKRVKYSLSEAYKGEKLPDNTKKVDRSTKYGNPFIVNKKGNLKNWEDRLKAGEFTREEALRLYEIYLDFVVKKNILDLTPLNGFNLACSCNLEDNCHADIILKKLKDERY